LRNHLTRHVAGTALRLRVRTLIREEASRRPWWERLAPKGPWLMPAAGFAFAALLASNVTLLAQRDSPQERIGQEILSSHVRAMVTQRPIDVESSDRHTVKPWYAGKIAFSPPVVDHAMQGFPLLGGRVDYINGERVAALVYARDKHVIDLYVWPAERGRDKAPMALASRGYNLLHWSSDGMSFWAASDVEPAELASLQRLVSGNIRDR